jgi:signal peptidase complex subunit 1
MFEVFYHYVKLTCTML